MDNKKIMTGGEIVIQTLVSHGVKLVFGIPGGHSLAMYDALCAHPDVKDIIARHEQGLGFMADGYARATGKTGVVLTTSGPAVANIATALGGATTDTSSVLVIASTVQRDLIGKNRGGLHDCGEQMSLIEGVTRYRKRCIDAGEIQGAVSELLNLLQTKRPGGAYCEIPVDVLNTKKEILIAEVTFPEREKLDSSLITKTIDLLMEAKKVLIIAGTGVTVSDAGNELRILAEKLSAPIIPTCLGKGIIPSSHPLVLNSLGPVKTSIFELITEADLVLAVGTMFKEEDTAAWYLKQPKRLIHIDIDPNEFNRRYNATLSIKGDAKELLREILENLKYKKLNKSSWVERLHKCQDEIYSNRKKQNPLEIKALELLRNSMPDDAILVADRCSLGYWASLYWRTDCPRTFQYPYCYGALGYALPAAIGAKIGRPEVPVVCVIGDGGFQFTLPELGTAVQYKVPITIVLLNDNGYGAIRAKQDRDYDGRHRGTDLLNPDFIKLAESYGIDAQRVDTLEKFEKVLPKSITSEKLNLIEIPFLLQNP